jgi:rare lipoprotein A (peptidoglycan hydrolase)
MSIPMLLRFGLALLHAPALAPASPVSVATASWYYDGGSTACGYHAYYGVAHRELSCGTHVLFAHGGRQVEAIVDDRGPFIYDRLWDLNQNTRASLSCPDLCTVRYRVMAR